MANTSCASRIVPEIASGLPSYTIRLPVHLVYLVMHRTHRSTLCLFPFLGVHTATALPITVLAVLFFFPCPRCWSVFLFTYRNKPCTEQSCFFLSSAPELLRFCSHVVSARHPICVQHIVGFAHEMYCAPPTRLYNFNISQPQLV